MNVSVRNPTGAPAADDKASAEEEIRPALLHANDECCTGRFTIHIKQENRRAIVLELTVRRWHYYSASGFDGIIEDDKISELSKSPDADRPRISRFTFTRFPAASHLL